MLNRERVSRTRPVLSPVVLVVGSVNDVVRSGFLSERARKRGFLAAARSRSSRSAWIADELYHSGEKDETDDDHSAL